MCLHLKVVLGLGVENLDAVENQALELDSQVKDFDGVDTAQFTNLINLRDSLFEEIDLLSETDMINEATIELISEDILTFESVNKGHFRKENGKFVNKSKEAIDSRKKVKEMWAA